MKKIVLCLLLLKAVAFCETLGLAGSFAVSVDYLYLMAAIDDSYYVISSDSRFIPNGLRYGNDPDYHSGFRVEGLYRLCSGLTDLRMRFTQMPRFGDTNRIAGQYLWGVDTLPGQPLAGAKGIAEIQDDFHFFMLEGLVGQKLIERRGFSCAFQAGVEFGYVRLREKAVFETTQIGVNPRLVEIKSRSSGAGPECAFSFAYKCFNWLHLTGCGSCALLIVDRTASYYDNGTLTGSAKSATKIGNDRPYYSILPTSDLRMGLALRGPFDFHRWFDCSPIIALGCLHVDLEVGYEIISFYKAFDRITFSDDVTTSVSVDNLMDFTLHGPYIHLGLSF